jgi:hypothetical protein
MKISQLKTFIVSLGIGEDQVETILSTSTCYEELIEQVRDYLTLIDAPVESKIMQLKRFIHNV